MNIPDVVAVGGCCKLNTSTAIGELLLLRQQMPLLWLLSIMMLFLKLVDIFLVGVSLCIQ